MQNEIDWWIFWGRLAGGLNRNQQADIYQRLSPFLLPRGGKKPQRSTTACCAKCGAPPPVWNCCPSAPKVELGDALVRRIKAGDFRESELWCLSRLGARELFYGPMNQVVPPVAAGRWAEALGGTGLLACPAAGDALAAIARRTEDPTRDLPPATLATVRRKLETLPHADRHLAVLDGDEQRDDRALGRIFGEELPSGLVLTSVPAAPSDP